MYKPLKVSAAALLPIVLLVLLFFAASALLASEPEAEWTFMVYMAADNNLEAATASDLNELEKYGSSNGVNFIVQIDRNGGYDTESQFNWVGAKRFRVVKDRTPKIASEEMADLGRVDMADPKTLLDFVSWGKEAFPAKKYALVLWNHGTGWKEIQPNIAETYEPSAIALRPERRAQAPRERVIQGALQLSAPAVSYNIAYDDTSRSSMSIPVLGEALEKIKDILGQPIDLLGFDACLMQMAEVAHTAYSSVRYQVGSPDLEPERGWPYDLIAGSLTKNPAMGPRELACIIARAYNASYAGGSQGNTAVAASVVNMQKTELFVKALNNFCNAARHNIHEIDKLEAARDAALKYYYGDYADLGDYLNKLIGLNPSIDIINAAHALHRVITGGKGAPGFVCSLEKSGKKFADSTGLSVFFPTRKGFKAYRTAYKAHSFAQATEWYNFLSELAVPNIPYLKIEEVVLEDNNKDGRIAPGEEVKVNFSIRNLGRKMPESANVVCKTDSGLTEGSEFSAVLTNLPPPGRVKLVEGFKLRVRKNAPIHSEAALSIRLSGNGLPESTIKTSFLVKEQFSAGGHALLVLTDQNSLSGRVLEDMLKKSNTVFDSWDRAIDGEIRSEVLKNYLDGWVLVVCQDSTPEQSLTDNEADALDAYLKCGGRLALDGQDIAFTLRDHPFLARRCKAAFVQDDVNVHVVSGQNGFCSGHDIQIFGGDGANNQKWPDEIDALEGAEVIFKYDEGARDMASDSDMNGPSHKIGSGVRGVASSGAAAIKVLDGYRLMLFGFGIESVNNASQRSEIMSEICSFMAPNTQSELKNLAKAASKGLNARRLSERAFIERADLLSSLEARLIGQIKQEIKQNPSRAYEILNTIRTMPLQEQRALKNLEKNVRSVLEFQKGHDTIR